MDAAGIVQVQLDAYNAQDLERFCACFAPDAVLGELNGAETQRGIAGVRERYAALFSEHPENRAELLNRIVVGDVVVDEERILRGKGIAPFRALAIYTVKSGFITRVDFVR
ncbi:MAG: nuclear transport factor 2 family protein [Terricaulis sp.]